MEGLIGCRAVQITLLASLEAQITYLESCNQESLSLVRTHLYYWKGKDKVSV